MENLRNLLERPFWVLDIEGDGHKVATPVEIGLVKFENGLVSEAKHWLINPGRRIDWFVTKNIHGISNEMVRNKPFFHHISEEFRRAISGQVVVGHAIDQDLNLLRPLMRDVDTLATTIDSRRLLKLIYPGKYKTNLTSACEKLGIPFATSSSHARGGFHDAVSDAQSCGNLFLELVRQIPADYTQARHITRCATFSATPNQIRTHLETIDENEEAPYSGPRP